MEYSATAKYLKMSTRKLRLVADSVRPLPVHQAVLYLRSIPKRAGIVLADVMASAIANAKQKNVSADALHIKLIEVMGGPVMKRWHAVSKGQAHAFKKRMTHVRVILTDEFKQKIGNPKSETN